MSEKPKPTIGDAFAELAKQFQPTPGGYVAPPPPPPTRWERTSKFLGHVIALGLMVLVALVVAVLIDLSLRVLF